MATLLIPTDTSQATLGYLLADGTIVGSTSQAQDFGSNGIKADAITESTGAAGVTISSVLSVVGLATGALGDYDLNVGDVTTPDYGIIRIGDSLLGRTSYNVGSLDVDGAMIFRNIGGPVTGQIEFCFTESGASAIRFALPKSGVGNATYNPRSMLLAGPAVNDDDVVTVGYWQTNNSIFDNLACDTAGAGADLGVQNDLEVEGDIFTDSIKESTSGAGVTIDNSLTINGLLNTAGSETVTASTNIVSLDRGLTIGADSLTIAQMLVTSGISNIGRTDTGLTGLAYSPSLTGGTFSTVAAIRTIPVLIASPVITTLRGIWVDVSGIPGAGSGTSIGIDLEDIGHANYDTAVIGLQIASLTASGAGATYQIRELGTNGFNVLAGNTRIGTTSDPTVALDVTGAALISSTLGVTGKTTVTDLIHIDADGSTTTNAMLFGAAAGGDAAMFWDGTDLIIDPTLVSAGDVVINADNAALALGAGSGGDARIYFNGTDVIIETRALGGEGDLNISDHVGIGAGGSPSALRLLNVSEAFSPSTASPMYGGFFQPTARPSSGSNQVFGLAGIAVWQGTGTSTGNLAAGLDFIARHNSSREIVDMKAMQVKLQSLAGGSGAITNAFGIDVKTAVWTGSAPTTITAMRLQDQGDASATTLNALHIEDQTAAGTTTRIIYQEGTTGHNILAANTSVASTSAPTSTVDINGSLAAATVAKTGAYTAAIGDHFIACDSSGGAFTVTLPAASGVAGRMYHIKKTDSSGNAVTVDGNSSETIDGATTQAITTQYDSMMIICDGSNWNII